MNQMSKALERTQEIYELYAKDYDIQRDKSLFEKKYLDIFLNELKRSPKVLDLGCGTGEPIGRYLEQRDAILYGADYSHAMLEIFRSRFPSAESFFVDMRNLRLSKKFDGIISWGAFFHLTIVQQRKVLPVLCDSLNEGGVLLLTIGDREGEVLGQVAGQSVYHASLSPLNYSQIISENGMSLLLLETNLKDCKGHSILLAKKNQNK